MTGDVRPRRYHDEVRSIYDEIEPEYDETRELQSAAYCMAFAQEIYRRNHALPRRYSKRLGRNHPELRGCYCFRSEDYFGIVHLYDDWGSGQMCVRCGRVYDMDKFDVRSELNALRGN